MSYCQSGTLKKFYKQKKPQNAPSLVYLHLEIDNPIYRRLNPLASFCFFLSSLGEPLWITEGWRCAGSGSAQH
jgi:hypothetical protein